MDNKEEHTRLLQEMNERLANMASNIEKTNIAQYVALMNNPRRLIIPNLIGGISRGVGIAIGLTIFTSTILYLLKALGALDLPIIGGYIADIVDHVQRQLEGRGY